MKKASGRKYFKAALGRPSEYIRSKPDLPFCWNLLSHSLICVRITP